MALFTTEELLTVVTADDAIAELKTELDDQGFSGDFDNPLSPERIYLSTAGRILEQVSGLAAYLHSGSLNDYAEGDQLTAISTSHFGNTRRSGNATQGDIIVHFNPDLSTDAPSRSWAAGELVFKISNVNSKKFFNTGTIALAVGGNLSGTFGFLAESIGSDGNVDNDEDTIVSIEPADVAVSSSFTTSDIEWWNIEGTDVEDDSSLKRRNSLTFAQFASGSLVRDRAKKIVFDAVPTIKDVFVDDSNPNGPFTVQFFVSSDLTTSPDADVIAARNVLTGAFFDRGGNLIGVTGSIELPFDKIITLYVDSNVAIAITKNQVNSAANEWLKTISIGGMTLSTNTNVASPNGLLNKLLNLSVVKGASLNNSTLISLKSGNNYLKLVAPTGGWDSAINYVYA